MIALEHRGQRAVVSESDGRIRHYAVDGLSALCEGGTEPDGPGGARALIFSVGDAVVSSRPASLVWNCVNQTPDSVELTASADDVQHSQGPLQHRLNYRLDASGLVASCHTTNVGTAVVRYVPQLEANLTVGSAIDEARLHAPVRAYLPTEKANATLRSIEHAPLNPRIAQRFGSKPVDLVFSGIERDYADRAYVTLFRPGARHVTLWFGEPYRHIAVSTSECRPEGCDHLAVRVMTSLPSEGDDNVIAIEPGSSHVTRWGLKVYRP